MKSLFSVFIVLVSFLIIQPFARAAVLLVDMNDAACSDITGTPYCSIQAAIDDASDNDEIQIAAGTYHEALVIDGIIITLQGAGQNTTILDGTSLTGAIITVPGASTVTLNDLGLKNANNTDSGYGGGLEIIDTDSVITINRCNISDNMADSGGAAIYAEAFTIEINDSIISNNQVGNDGGAIDLADGVLTVNSSEFSTNKALGGAGGAIRLTGSTSLIFNNSVMKQNESTGEGGALKMEGSSTATITGSTIEQNIAMNDGGGIAAITLPVGELSIETSRITNNETTSPGGGIFSNGTILTISKSLIDNNKADSVGGGLFFSNSTDDGHISNSTISGNQSKTNGGGIYSGTGNLILDNVTITGNIADSDAGEASDVAAGDGGGIFNNDSTLGVTTLRNTIVAGNEDPTSDPDCFGTLTSDGFNLIETVSTGCTFAAMASDITGEDPLLDVLADNGGLTLTHDLKVGSPAIDKGDCLDSDGAPVVDDQRGSERPDDNCDMGAVEASTCGDDILAVDEECDDGNLVDGDGCSSVCEIEDTGGGGGGTSSGCHLASIETMNSSAGIFMLMGFLVLGLVSLRKRVQN